MEARERIIVALDVPEVAQAERLINELAHLVGCFKIGLELITAGAHLQVAELAAKQGLKCFLDGKFNDIPNTVGAAAKRAAEAGFAMFNVHASSGIPAMRIAKQNAGNAKVLAVTILTSLEDEAYLIYGGPVKAKVLQFARDAVTAGCDGIICSPEELQFLAQYTELNRLLRVTPGVRPRWAAADDQKRIATPREAIECGADYIVVGRPITAYPREVGGPPLAATQIATEITLGELALSAAGRTAKV